MYGKSQPKPQNGNINARLLSIDVSVPVALYTTGIDLIKEVVKRYRTLPVTRTRKATHPEDVMAILNTTTHRLLRLNSKVLDQIHTLSTDSGSGSGGLGISNPVASFHHNANETLWLVTTKEFTLFYTWMVRAIL